MNKRILIVGPSWVGDMVMAQTLFKRLHERHPNLTLDVLAPFWTMPLLQHMPEVNDAIVNPFTHGQFQLLNRYRFAQTLRARQYDQAIVLPNSLKSALIPFFARIPLRTGFIGEMRYGLLNDARKLDEEALPLMVERFCALAEPANSPLCKRGVGGDFTHGLNLGQLAPCLHVDEAERRAVLHKFRLVSNGPIAVFCIGAEYGPAKRWPVEHFAALAEKLAEKNYAVWLVGSMKDAPIGNAIEKMAKGKCKNLCGETDLSEAISLIDASSVVVSNDSGLMHVAAALDKPMVALYGSSSPGFTPPLSDKAHVLSLNLECSPCFKRECPLGHFNCMKQLTPERVFDELGQIQSFSNPNPDAC